MGRREIERPADLDLGTMVRMVRRHSWRVDPSENGPRGGRTTVFANGVIEEVVEGCPTRYYQIDDDEPAETDEVG